MSLLGLGALLASCPHPARPLRLALEDITDGIAYMVSRPRHTAIGELWIMPTDQA